MTTRRWRVAVLYGGPSAEHDVSVETGRAVLAHLDGRRFEAIAVFIDRDGQWHVGGGHTVGPAAGVAWLVDRRVDVVFPALHGPFGEDGTLQGALEVAGLRYVGSGVRASAVAMDKVVTKALLASCGLPVVGGTSVAGDRFASRPDATVAEVVEQVGLPAFVKPATQGSSVGAGVATDVATLRACIEAALAHADTVVVEPRLDGLEVTCPVLEWGQPRRPRALPLIEIRPLGHAFFDYVSKYTPGHNEEICPARLPAALAERIAALGERAHAIVGCRSLSRTDTIVVDGEPYILEINTVPGLTPESLYPKAARAAGLDFAALVTELVLGAATRHPDVSAPR